MNDTNRPTTEDEDWLSKASLAARHTRPARTPSFYRLRELDAFPPSERGALLHDALAGADHGWFLVRELALSLTCAAGVSLLLLPRHWSSGRTSLAVGAAFCICFLLVRRENVRRLLRQQRVRARWQGGHAAGELFDVPAVERGSRHWMASLAWRVREWACFRPWSH